jgi:predicted nucleotidyltransferase
MFTKINDIDLKVLSVFTNGYYLEYYIREIQKILEISSRTALKTLNKLEEKGILKSKQKGKIRLFTIKKTLIAREYLCLAEQYKKIKLYERELLIKEIFEKIDDFIDGIVIIFGSYAKNLVKKNSDLDLFIIGQYNEKKIKKVGNIYNLNIDLKSYPKKVFLENLNHDILLKEILNNHITIKGTQNFVSQIIK